MRKRISSWTLLLIGLGSLLAAVLVLSVNKPLPTYLVAKSNLTAGQELVDADFEIVNLYLGPLADKYLSRIQANTSVISQIPAGELVPLSRIGRELLPNQTSVRIVPSTKPASNVAAGSWVSIWQVVEIEDKFEPQLLVESAEVLAVEYSEGLFADEIPEVEILLGSEQATLLITALAAKHEVFVLPKS
jgi:hypothetical protein